MNDKIARFEEPTADYSAYPYSEETYKIRGAIFEVYRELGCGFAEAVYQECLEREFTLQNIPFKSQYSLPIFYKGTRISQSYQPDLVCYDKVIVELKALREICDDHRAQLMNYLKASGFTLGLIVNFGHYPKVDIERFIL